MRSTGRLGMGGVVVGLVVLGLSLPPGTTGSATKTATAAGNRNVATATAGGIAFAGAAAGGRSVVPADDPYATIASDGVAPTGRMRLRPILPYEGSGRLQRTTTDRHEVSPVPGDGGADGAGGRAVLGGDTRLEVGDTTAYPARAVVLVEVTTDQGRRGRCTGAMIAPDLVATAGHCLHGGPGRGWYRQVRVFPGADGSIAPFGSCGATRLLTLAGWRDRGSRRYDVGAIRLDCAIGRRTGWFGMTSVGSGASDTTMVMGYPVDKPRTAWASWNGAVGATRTRLWYRNDTTGGMSGAPVTQYRGERCEVHCIVAIHTNGPGMAPHPEVNSGRRIDRTILDVYKTWVAG